MRRAYLAIGLPLALAACSAVLDFHELEGKPAAACAAADPHDADPHNCGSCGHDCLGGDCAAGRCQPVILARGLAGAAQVRADGDALFVATAGQLVRVPKSGAASAVIAVDEGLLNLAIFGGAVYVVGTAGAGRVSVDGGVLDRLDEDGLGDIAADADYAYRCTYAGAVKGKSVVSRRRHTDGARLDLAGQLTACETVQIGGGHVFYGESGPDDVGVWSVPSGGGVPVQLAPRAARRIAVDDAYAYFVQYHDSAVRRVPLGGGPDAVVASTSPVEVGPGDIVVDDAFVYWAVAKPAAEGGAVYRAPKTGGVAESIAGPIDSPRGVAVDSAAIYWTEDGAGTVTKLAR